MQRSDIRRYLMSGARLGATVLLSSSLTAVALTALTPEAAHTDSRPIVIVEGEALYPCSGGEAPVTTFESHEDLVADYLRLKAEVAELRHAIDYDAMYGHVGPSVHEWADRRPAGTYGGGRKP